MPTLRVIAGSATSRSLEAIVVSGFGADVPIVRVAGSSEVEVLPTMLPADGSWGRGTELLDELAKRAVHVFRVRVSGLSAGAAYAIVAAVAGTNATITVRTLPSSLPQRGIQVALATCYYDGFKRGESLYRELASPLTRRDTDFAFFAGDNVYLDVPAFDSDLDAYEGTAERYVRYFLESRYALARGAQTTFTTLDDHDFWNNFPKSMPWLSRGRRRNHASYTDAARSAAYVFGAQLNPPSKSGRAFRLDVPPLSFFVADLRSDRDIEHGRMMAPGDRLAVLDWLRTLSGPGVLVTSQPLWIEAGGRVKDRNPPFFQREYDELLRAIVDAPFDVLVLSGDVHYSSAMRLGYVPSSGSKRTFYEIISSPACHIPDGLRALRDGSPDVDAQPRASLATIPKPGEVPGFAKSLSPEIYFATNVSNTFALVGFRPTTDPRRVEVDLTFVDHARGEVPRCEPVAPEFGLPLHTGACDASALFTLGPR